LVTRRSFQLLAAQWQTELERRSQALQMIEELTLLSKVRFVPAFYFALVCAGLEDKDQA